jgi:hypothetical protein
MTMTKRIGKAGRDGDDSLGREARRILLSKRWSQMSADERRTVRVYRADLDRRLVAMIERYRSPARTSPDS